jgi:F-type H+-transporting ATPase subunit gamma
VATLKDIQRRIRSVKKTQQITSAMRMVAAAKLRRAQDAIIAARPYTTRMYQLLREIGRREKQVEHPLLARHTERKTVEVLVVTSDRGLCGAFNISALKTGDRTIAEQRRTAGRVLVTPIGRKAADYYRRRRPQDIGRIWMGYPRVEYAQAVEIAEYLSTRYASGEIDGAIVVGNEFVSALTQRPRSLVLLPFTADEDEPEPAEAPPPFVMEPNPAALLDVLIPQALEFSVYRVLLENQAGESAARMTAMESATRNTEELIETLTLQFNRARQAAITKELMEIVSGAEALA